jgi:hypothetical protein
VNAGSRATSITRPASGVAIPSMVTCGEPEVHGRRAPLRHPHPHPRHAALQQHGHDAARGHTLAGIERGLIDDTVHGRPQHELIEAVAGGGQHGLRLAHTCGRFVTGELRALEILLGGDARLPKPHGPLELVGRRRLPGACAGQAGFGARHLGLDHRGIEPRQHVSRTNLLAATGAKLDERLGNGRHQLDECPLDRADEHEISAVAAARGDERQQHDHRTPARRPRRAVSHERAAHHAACAPGLATALPQRSPAAVAESHAAALHVPSAPITIEHTSPSGQTPTPCPLVSHPHTDAEGGQRQKVECSGNPKSMSTA